MRRSEKLKPAAKIGGRSVLFGPPSLRLHHLLLCVILLRSVTLRESRRDYPRLLLIWGSFWFRRWVHQGLCIDATTTLHPSRTHDPLRVLRQLLAHHGMSFQIFIQFWMAG